MKFHFILIIVLVNRVTGQNFVSPTPLDGFVRQYQFFRGVLIKALGRNSVDPTNMAKARALNLLQEPVPLSVKFPCNVTGFRSFEVPSNVNKLRPGDIDVIGALGDSITSGNGIVATELIQIVIENRGLSWSIGGQGTWREFLTLPNILKEFNPNLVGYSIGDSIGIQKESQFNLAETASFSSELPHMTKVLIQRMKSDPRVNIHKDWKLITVFIGINNFCLDICYQHNPENVLTYHRNDLLRVFRLLKRNLPRTIVNMVPTPDVSLIKKLVPLKPRYCEIANTAECFCMLRSNASQIEIYARIIKKWQMLEEEVANMEEFNTDDFTINFQPFPLNFKFPRNANNKLDMSYLSQDCHHISQKQDAELANALWNNMLEREGEKTTKTYRLFDRFLCPSESQPFIFTKTNSLL